MSKLEIHIDDKQAISGFVDHNNCVGKIADLFDSAKRSLVQSLTNKKIEAINKRLLKALEQADKAAKELSTIYYDSTTVYNSGAKMDKYGNWIEPK